VKLKQAGIFIVLLGLLFGLVIGCQPEFQPGTYIDDMGRQVEINEAPERIVSHVPSITEILFALDVNEKVVGVSDYCDFPEEAKLKPSVGNYFNPSIENIVSLEPDLVLTDGHIESIKRLDDLGIVYMVIEPKDIDGIFRDIELLGKVIGVEERAGELVEEMRADISLVLDRVENSPTVRVFYVIDATDLSNPWTAGPGSFVDSFICMAGGENIAAEAPAPWVQFSIEEVINLDPEIIILTTRHGTLFTSPEQLKKHPAWRETTAVKQDRIHVIDADLVDRAGPRIVRGLEEIAKIIHPELFK
jgi:iron complex transport system substrate-binding protein